MAFLIKNKMKKAFEVALILSATDKATRVVSEATTKINNQMKKVGSMADSAFGVGRTSGAIGLAILAPLALSVNAAEESEIAFRRLSSTFKTMGETDNKAAIAAANYASQLQTRIGVEDEEIQAVQSKIASFRKVSDETARMSGVFDRATEAAFDLAAGGFGEASSNAVQLGKALQNPALGAQALAKAGALNKSDIPLIKQIQATYGLGAAQEYVLKAVEKQVKGQAANTATSAAKMKVAFSEVAETAGKTLLPTVAKTMASVGKAADRFNKWAQDNPKLLSTIIKVVGGLGLLSLAVSAVAFLFGGLLKVYQGMLAVKRLYLILTNAETFSKIKLNAVIWYTVAAEKAAAASKWLLGVASKALLIPTYLQTAATWAASAATWAFNAALLANPIAWVIIAVIALIAIVILLVKNWDKVSAFFRNLWEKIKGFFAAAWEFVKKWGWLMLGPVGWMIKGWSLLIQFFPQIWAKVKQVFIGFWDWLKKLPAQFLLIGSNIVMGIWEGIKSKATALFSYVKDIGKKIAGAFKSVLGIASPSKVFMDYGVNITEGAKKGIEKGSPALVGASGNMAQGISPNRSGRGGGGGGGITVTFAPVIHGAGNPQDILAAIKQYTPQLIRELEAAWARKQRLSY